MNTDFSFTSDTLNVSAHKLICNNMARCHSHTSYELYFLMEGERYLFLGGEFYPVKAGDVFLIPPELEHRTLDSGAGKYFRLTANIPTKSMPYPLSRDSVYFVTPSERGLKRLYAEAKEIIETDTASRGAVCSILGSVMKMLSVVLSEDGGELPSPISSQSLGRVSEIVAFVDAHSSERISLTDISERFFISEFYLCRLFKEYTGRTIMDYITEKRIRHAKRLLRDTDDKISTVARLAGFGSASAFGAAFRQRCGMSPREYRTKSRV